MLASEIKEKESNLEKNLTQSYTIKTEDKTIPHILVTQGIKEPFLSGELFIKEAKTYQSQFFHLWEYNDKNIREAPAKDLFCLSQMSHPKDYGISVNRSTLLELWEQKGKNLFKELGYPTDLNYPYVNIHTGYGSITTLGTQIGVGDKWGVKWWSAIEHTRPIADLNKAINHINKLLKEQEEKQSEIINPQTGKPLKKFMQEARDIDWDMEQLRASRSVVESYINKPEGIPEPFSKKTKSNRTDYLDRVIAYLHENYANDKRLTKGQIEKLQEQLQIPNKGLLWEAAELSWLLWYKQLYHQNLPFETRLRQMIHFWDNLQPTYAYSDSSKELYKQYSTPCPIGAIIAQYTKMDTAQYIFEPSAGNGFTSCGRKTRIKTHVNEIDLTRLESLKFQQFKKITQVNAIEAFPRGLEWAL